VQESFAMLTKYEMSAPQEQMDECDSLRYLWEKLQATGAKVSDQLIDIQAPFKDALIQNVVTFNKDCKEFYQAYKEVSACTFHLL
jgi:dynein heavy chain